MSAALRLHNPDPSPASDVTKAYLDRLARGLRLPPAHRDQVIDELSWHLEERVRDLMVTGIHESEATERAIRELGDPGVLARRFEAAHRAPRRRRTMNMLMIGLASAAAVAGALTLQPSQVTVRSAVFDAAPQHQRIETLVNFQSRSGDVMWNDFFGFLAQASNRTAVVYWSSLREMGVDTFAPEMSMNLSSFSGEMSVDECVELINSELGLPSDNHLEYRDDNGRLMFATTEYFDRRETRLVTYDVSDLVRARFADGAEDPQQVSIAVEEITGLIRQLVESSIWDTNGGDRGSISAYGTKLFVRAPQRLLKQVEWVLAQAGGAHPGAKDAAGHAAPDPRAAARVEDLVGFRKTPAAAPVSVTVRLSCVSPDAARDVLGTMFNHVPTLAPSTFTRTFEVDESSGTLTVTTSPRAAEFVVRLLNAIDRPAAPVAAAATSTQVIPLSRISSNQAEAMLKGVASTSSSLAISVTPDVRQNALLITGSSDQLAALAAVVSLLDADWTEATPQQTVQAEHSGVSGEAGIQPSRSGPPALA